MVAAPRRGAAILLCGDDGLEWNDSFSVPTLPSLVLELLWFGSMCRAAPEDDIFPLVSADEGGVMGGLTDTAGLLLPDPCLPAAEAAAFPIPPVTAGVVGPPTDDAKEEEGTGTGLGKVCCFVLDVIAGFAEEGSGDAGETAGGGDAAASFAARSSARLFFLVSCVAFPVTFAGAKATVEDWATFTAEAVGFGRASAAGVRTTTSGLEPPPPSGGLNEAPSVGGEEGEAVGRASGFRSERGCCMFFFFC